MVNIILISHGAFCEGLLANLQMIAGGSYGMRAVPLIPGESPETYCEKLETVMWEAGDGSGSETIILPDIAGGTPFQSVAYLSGGFGLRLISDMDMPILLTLTLEHSEETTLEELADKVGISSTAGVKTAVLKKGEKRQHVKLSINENQ